MQTWAIKYLRLSWANGYISRQALDDCFSYIPRNRAGAEVYLIEASKEGQPLDKGISYYRPSNTIGYYTNGSNYALVFLYKMFENDIYVVSKILGIGNVPGAIKVILSDYIPTSP